MKKLLLKELIENDIRISKKFLNKSLRENEEILDGMVVDKDTLEDIRKASEEELEWFYAIRLNEMRLRNLEE
jgi:hypothetical protein